MKEVKSKVYKAVKGKDGKCILVKKKRVKPKTKKVKKPKTKVAPIQTRPPKRETVRERVIERESVKPKKERTTILDVLAAAADVNKNRRKEEREEKEKKKPKKTERIRFTKQLRVEDFPEATRAAGKKRGGKKPIPVRIVPDSPPPPPTEIETLMNRKAALNQKLEEDKKAKYDRNVALNAKESQQGLVLGERGLLSKSTKIIDEPINGKGVEEDGMYDYEIEDVMKKYPEFKGVIAADEIRSLPGKDKIAFIMNTADRDEPGEHWQSVLIDASPNVRAVEFFDSFGKPPPTKVKKDIKGLVNKMKPETMLLYKWNKVIQQNNNSNTCGLHAMNFLMKRLNGQSFIEATGYNKSKPKNQSRKYENEVSKKFTEFF